MTSRAYRAFRAYHATALVVGQLCGFRRYPFAPTLPRLSRYRRGR